MEWTHLFVFHAAPNQLARVQKRQYFFEGQGPLIRDCSVRLTTAEAIIKFDSGMFLAILDVLLNFVGVNVGLMYPPSYEPVLLTQ